MKQRILDMVILISALAMAGCEGRETVTIMPKSNDTLGPTFNRITTSSKGFSIECVPTSVTVTANITDQSGIAHAVLWYRVGTDQSYTPVDMHHLSGNSYRATVKALDMPVGVHGIWEFYIAAQDMEGNQAKSKIDTSVQLLPCVAN